MAVGSSPLDGIRTPDGRYLVVRARLWRAANPSLTVDERGDLVRALMEARRAVGIARRRGDDVAAQQTQRRVHRLKVALGERGPVWWEDGAADHNRRMVDNTPYAEWYERAQGWANTIDQLLGTRATGASVCPSEVARAGARHHWRQYLDEVREVARHLARRQLLTITQRGRIVSPDAAVRGPVRLARP